MPPSPPPTPDDPAPGPPDGPDERFSWEGGPGYAPVDPDRLTPHAPMPGAPPYPAATEHPPPPVGVPAAGTRARTALLAAAAWGVVNLVLVFVVAGAPPSARALGALAGMVVAAVLVAGLLTWLVARRRPWPFWALLLVTGLVFWVVRAATTSGPA